METCPFKTSENTLRCCLCPLKIFSRCRGAFHPFRATAGNVKKLGENGKFLPDEKKIAKPLFCRYSAPAFLSSTISNGQVSEWSNEHAWKVCVPQTGTEGSNPSLSAINFPPQCILMNMLRSLFKRVWRRKVEEETGHTFVDRHTTFNGIIMDVKEHYTKLGNTISDILNNTLINENVDLLSLNHCFIDDFGKLLVLLQKRPEYQILENAIKEYQISILSNILGFYQQSFMSLRFFLERTLAAVLFSTNELELNLWRLGERDTYWNELVDKETGIFSLKFCKAFFPELKDEIEHFRAMTCKVYRECSEYVHANQHII